MHKELYRCDMLKRKYAGGGENFTIVMEGLQGKGQLVMITCFMKPCDAGNKRNSNTLFYKFRVINGRLAQRFS